MRLAPTRAGFLGADLLGRACAGHTGSPYDHDATRRTRPRRRGGPPATSALALWRWGDPLAGGAGAAGLGGVAEWKDPGATDIDGSWVRGTENAPRLMYGETAIRPRQVVADRGCRSLVGPGARRGGRPTACAQAGAPAVLAVGCRRAPSLRRRPCSVSLVVTGQRPVSSTPSRSSISCTVIPGVLVDHSNTWT